MKVYRTPPQAERRAAAEMRRAKFKAAVPMERRHKARAKVVAPGYVFGEGRPPEAIYSRECIGTVTRADVQALHIKRVRTDLPSVQRRIAVGDTVRLPPIGQHKIEITGKVTKVRGNRLSVLPDGGSRTVQVSLDMVRL